MLNRKLDIGMALSGGGVRAAVFHFGVLARLARDGLLEDVTFLSTVSGGSIAIGLVFTLADNRWPSSRMFLEEILPETRQRLTSSSIQSDYVRRTLCRPWLLAQGRAKVIAESLRHCWGVEGLLRDLSTTPRWIINAATYETGKNWRFMPQRMGDYEIGYVPEPAFPVAEAVAASAAVPLAIGPLVLHTRDYRWYRYASSPGSMAGDDPETRTNNLCPAEVPQFRRLHLWDAGVYDNLGVEALFKGDRFRDGINFLIVSDASAALRFSWLDRVQRTNRLISIATDQVRSLRARMIVGFFDRTPGSGVYLHIGNIAEHLVRDAKADPTSHADLLAAGLPEHEARIAATLGTHLKRISPSVFDRLCRHGWEVADGTLSTRCGPTFTHRPWGGW